MCTNKLPAIRYYNYVHVHVLCTLFTTYIFCDPYQFPTIYTSPGSIVSVASALSLAALS